jgi:hypothetical protein
MAIYTNRVYDNTDLAFQRWDTATPLDPTGYPGSDFPGSTDRCVESVRDSGGVVDHGGLLGLVPDDDHTQYALLAGRSGPGGQLLHGGTLGGEDLTLRGTAHATPGQIVIQASDLNLGGNNILGVGTYTGAGNITTSAGNVILSAGTVQGTAATGNLAAVLTAIDGDEQAVLNLVTSTGGGGTNPGDAKVYVGNRTPEGNVDAAQGALYIRKDATPGSSSVYVKTTALATLTGWVDLRTAGSGVPGGADTNVQFNNAGAFGGSGNFTWNGALVGITGALTASGIITGNGGFVVASGGSITPFNATTTGADSVAMINLDNTGGTNGALARILVGDRNPQATVSAVPGSLYIRSDGTASEDSALYINITAGGAPGTDWDLLESSSIDMQDTYDVDGSVALDVTGVNDLEWTAADTADTVFSILRDPAGDTRLKAPDEPDDSGNTGTQVVLQGAKGSDVTSPGSGTTGGLALVLGGVGGSADGANAGGTGGATNVTGGLGGNAGTGGDGGNGGETAVTSGAGSAGDGAGTGGASGNLLLKSGTPGTAGATGDGGDSGGVVLQVANAAAGGATSGLGGAGGDLDLFAGSGGGATLGNAGNGGALSLFSGAGGTSSDGDGGTGGGFDIDLGNGGSGGGTNAPGGDAGNLSIVAGSGLGGDGVGTGAGGDGATINLPAGDGGSSSGSGTGGDGGDFIIDAGAFGSSGSGTDGTDGIIQIGATNARVVELGRAGRVTTVKGDFLVEGTTTTINSTTVSVADQHMYLNAGYTAAAPRSGGLVVNNDPQATATDTVNGVYVAGVIATSDATVVTTAASVFTVGMLVEISGSTNNNGLYEVVSHAANLLTIRGVLTATVEDFTNTDFTAGASDGATIKHTQVSVVRAKADVTGAWETGVGHTTPLTFSDLVTGSTATWIGLTDTPASYASGDADKLTGVSTTFDGIEYKDNTYLTAEDTLRVQDSGFFAGTGDPGNRTDVGATGLNSVVIGNNNTGAAMGAGGGVIALGSNAAQSITGVQGNLVAIGLDAANLLTTGNQVFVGVQSGQYITGENNVASGWRALRGTAATQSGIDNNVAIGDEALSGITTGATQNVGVGRGALKAVGAGDKNTAVGDNAGLTATGSRNTIIGDAMDVSSAAVNDELWIGSNGVPILSGRMDYQRIRLGNSTAAISTNRQGIDLDDGHIENAVTITYGSSPDTDTATGSWTPDFSTGQKIEVTVSGNITAVNAPTAPPGIGNFIMVLKQSGGPHTIAGWNAVYKFPNGGTAPTLTASANAIDMLGVYYDGTDYYVQIAKDFQ